MESQQPNLARFVLLRHYCQSDQSGEDHFDFMIENLELGADEHSLTTWRLPLWPFDNQQIVLQLPAHRIEWLNREGRVSEGRGFVKRVCRGHCRVLGHTPDRWHVCFQTIDLNPEDPAVADAWPGIKNEVELVFENSREPNVDDCWQVSVL